MEGYAPGMMFSAGMLGPGFLPPGMGMMENPGMMTPAAFPGAAPPGGPFFRPPGLEGIDENSRRPGSLNGSFFHKTRMCQKWQEGSCTFGDRCNFAHGAAEIRKLPPEMVRAYEAQKAQVQAQQAQVQAQQALMQQARAAASATAAAVVPLRAAPDSSPAAAALTTPGSEAGQPQVPTREYFYKTRLCEKYMSGAGCPYGPRCHYAHGDHELRQKGETRVGPWLRCMLAAPLVKLIENGVPLRVPAAAQPGSGLPPGMVAMLPGMLPPGARPPPPRPPPGPPPADHPRVSVAGVRPLQMGSTAKPMPISEVTYVDRIRAMSALFAVGDLKLSEINPGALHAVQATIQDGSIYAGNHYADSVAELLNPA